MHFPTFALGILVGFLIWGPAPPVHGEADPAGQGGPQDAKVVGAREEVVRLIRDLDAAEYSLRQRAAEQLRRMAARTELVPVLTEEFQRTLVAPDTSFEVRRRLESLAASLPKPAAPTGQVPLDEVDRLIRQLEDDEYGKRASARARLEWLGSNPRMVCPLLLRFKARLEEGSLAVDAQRWLEPLYLQTRSAWLGSDPATWTLPPISDTQIAGWIGDLARPADQPQDPCEDRARKRALRELRDALARDDEVSRVKAALESRLVAPGLDPPAVARVKSLIDLTRPEMVAECWGRVAPAMPCRMARPPQRLVIGVPSLGPGAERASHFDRIDDHVAHCVSGQNLTPGDYPVGVAFPHPKQPGYFFRLVNLTSPRRQMAYECQADVPDSRRLAELSRTTFDWLLARKKPLAAGELNMLRLLDREELSRFAGRFLDLVEDEPVPEKELKGVAEIYQSQALPNDFAPLRRLPTARASRHGKLCESLVAGGTRAAAPGLLRAIEKGRVLPPTKSAPCRLDALALLAIAAREPCPETDAALSGLLGRSDLLVLGPDGAPEVAATAAGLLLRRHGQQPSDFGLRPADEPVLQSAGLSGYRFAAPEAREKFRRWWAGRKEQPDGA